MASPTLLAAAGPHLSSLQTCWHIWSGGAPIITGVASSPLTAGEARTAVRARGKVDGTTLPATDAGDGSRKNHPTMDDRRGALVPLTKGVCLRGIQTRWRCSFMLRADG